MPMHEYRCQPCDVNFDHLFKTYDEVTENRDCPFCGQVSAKQISAANFAFGTPIMTRDGNSGVYSVDSNLDQQVGRDAVKRKRVMADRASHKAAVRRDTGKDILTRTGNSEYEPTPEKIVVARNKLASGMNNAFKEAKRDHDGRAVSPSPSP